MLENNVKIKILKNKEMQLEQQLFDYEINLEVHEACGDNEEVIKATKSAIAKQKIALSVINLKLETIEGVSLNVINTESKAKDANLVETEA